MADYAKLLTVLRSCAKTDCGDCVYIENCIAGSREKGWYGNETLLQNAADAIKELLEKERSVSCQTQAN